MFQIRFIVPVMVRICNKTCHLTGNRRHHPLKFTVSGNSGEAENPGLRKEPEIPGKGRGFKLQRIFSPLPGYPVYPGAVDGAKHRDPGRLLADGGNSRGIRVLHPCKDYGIGPPQGAYRFAKRPPGKEVAVSKSG